MPGAFFTSDRWVHSLFKQVCASPARLLSCMGCGSCGRMVKWMEQEFARIAVRTRTHPDSSGAPPTNSRALDWQARAGLLCGTCSVLHNDLCVCSAIPGKKKSVVINLRNSVVCWDSLHWAWVDYWLYTCVCLAEMRAPPPFIESEVTAQSRNLFLCFLMLPVHCSFLFFFVFCKTAVRKTWNSHRPSRRSSFWVASCIHLLQLPGSWETGAEPVGEFVKMNVIMTSA